ncbi:MAG: hypothetical protein AB9846_16835 [Tenuifilaceae bacterium]
MSWNFRSKEQDPNLLRLVECINKRNGSKLVSADSSTYYVTELPFYNSFKLFTLADLSFTPYFKQQFLDNGQYTFVLDGTQTPFIEANSISPIILTSKNVFSYAQLVLCHINKKDCSYRLVSSMEDVEFSSEPTPEQYEKLIASIQKPKIETDKDSFLISCSYILDDSVFEGLIKVTFDGRVEILNEKIILENMPVKELIPEL